MLPVPAIPPASESFSHGLPQDLLIQGQVGDELLELPVLLAELPELPDLGDPQAPKPLLPAVEGRFTDAELPADLLDGSPRLRLPEGHGDLLRGIPTRLHGPPPSRAGPDCHSKRES